MFAQINNDLSSELVDDVVRAVEQFTGSEAVLGFAPFDEDAIELFSRQLAE